MQVFTGFHIHGFRLTFASLYAAFKDGWDDGTLEGSIDTISEHVVGP